MGKCTAHVDSTMPNDAKSPNTAMRARTIARAWSERVMVLASVASPQDDLRDDTSRTVT
jgi:hypothetical protein